MNHAAPNDASAALKGASLAFQRSPPAATAQPTEPPSLSANPKKGAEAASSVSRSRSRRRESSNGNGADYDSIVAYPLHVRPQQSSATSPAPAQQPDPKSPSFIAASLAASRSASPSPMRHPSRPDSGFSAARALGSLDDAVDSGSIAPTGNLISLFEGTQAMEPRGKRQRSRPSPASDTGAQKLKPSVQASQTKLKPTPRTKPETKPKSKSTVPAPATPPLTDLALADATIPQNSPSPSPSTSRAAERISAMPMPKPQQLKTTTPARTPNKSPPPPPPPPPPLPRPIQQTQQQVSAAASETPDQSANHARSAKKMQLKSLKVRPRPSSPPVISRSTPEVLSPKPVRLVKPVLAHPSFRTSPHDDGSTAAQQPVASPLPDPRKKSPPNARPPPTPPKPRGSYRLSVSQSTSRSRRRRNSHSPSLDSSEFLAAPLTEFGLPVVSPVPSQPRQHHKKTLPSLPGRRSSVASAPSSPGLEASRPSRHRLTAGYLGNLSLDPLTNAMMASSLASSRLTPQSTGHSLPPPSIPKRQQSPRFLQTLRKPQTPLEEDPERLKLANRQKASNHKHAHREGTRNRWRGFITQRERKRYEAVWASNRGYLLEADDGPGSSSDRLASSSGNRGNSRSRSECVANVVVREIWKRSRLPKEELGEVWELVDRGGVGMLTRQEFVVGMWLIDQRLKGGKVPVRVSDSVWDSANGVHVLKPKG